MNNIAPEKPMTFWAAVSLGVGAMIGAGIFALLGEAGAIAGSAAYISFIVGGTIALASGYSMFAVGIPFIVIVGEPDTSRSELYAQSN